MNSRTKKLISVIAIIVVVIVAAVLVLGFIGVKPLKDFEGYSRVAICNGAAAEFPETETTKKRLDEEVKNVKFSVLRGMFTDYGIKQETIEKDGETSPITYTADEIANFVAGSGEYALRFYYDAVQTNAKFKDADGKEIPFDRLLVVFKGDEKIQSFKLIPYLDVNIGNQAQNDEPDENGVIGSEYYTVYRFTAKADMSELYETVRKICGDEIVDEDDTTDDDDTSDDNEDSGNTDVA